MDRSLVVHGVKKADGKVLSVEINVDDYVNSKADFKARDLGSVFKDLGRLVNLFEEQLGSRLVPPLPEEKKAERVDLRVPRVDPLIDTSWQPRVPLPLHGDFDNDWRAPAPDPFTGGIPNFGGGGSLMGPTHPLFSGRGRGLGRGVPRPRFDPYGPTQGFGEPDNDNLPPPGPSGPNPYL